MTLSGCADKGGDLQAWYNASADRRIALHECVIAQDMACTTIAYASHVAGLNAALAVPR